MQNLNVVESSKENFYINLEKKLNDPSTSNKTYWSIIKTFINGKKSSCYSLKLSNSTKTKPLSIINKNCLQQGLFPNDWEKGNIISVHKKNSKQIVNKCRPVSLLLIYFKIFEKLIFNSIYELVNKNNIFNDNQSGFRPNDSRIHQLIAITHNIFNVFDANPSLEVHGVFLDLSKAFDRVWRDGLLYILRSNRIDDNL